MEAQVKYQAWCKYKECYEERKVIVDATDFADAYDKACDIDPCLEKEK